MDNRTYPIAISLSLDLHRPSRSWASWRVHTSADPDVVASDTRTVYNDVSRGEYYRVESDAELLAEIGRQMRPLRPWIVRNWDGAVLLYGRAADARRAGADHGCRFVGQATTTEETTTLAGEA